MKHQKKPEQNLDLYRLFVRQGKRRKDRYVPIGQRALAWITKKYQTEVCPYHQWPSSPDTLFLDKTGKALDPYKISRAVKKYVKQANINKEGSCHLFRHTMATVMLNNGADIRFIQQMLGHSQLSTTEIYTHVTIHKLKEIHTLTHPVILEKPTQHQDTEDDLFIILAAEEAEEISMIKLRHWRTMSDYGYYRNSNLYAFD